MQAKNGGARYWDYCTILEFFVKALSYLEMLHRIFFGKCIFLREILPDCDFFIRERLLLIDHLCKFWINTTYMVMSKSIVQEWNLI
jgi:hypothetical protein